MLGDDDKKPFKSQEENWGGGLFSKVLNQRGKAHHITLSPPSELSDSNPPIHAGKNNSEREGTPYLEHYKGRY